MKTFPAFEAALKNKNQKALRMLGKVLSKCDKLRHLGIGFQHPTGQFLPFLDRLFKLLRSIEIPEIFSNLEERSPTYIKYRQEIYSAIERLESFPGTTDNDLIIIVRGQLDVNLLSALADIYKECERWKKSPSVFIDLQDQTQGRFELAELLNESVKRLYLFDHDKRVRLKEMPVCSKLTHLSLGGVLYKRIVRGFMDKFPQLTQITECSCEKDESLSSLFQSKYSTVTRLDLRGFELKEEDLDFLHSVNMDTDNSVLPNLSSLVLDSRTCELQSSLHILFQNPWDKLTKIDFKCFATNLGRYDLKEFICIINESKIPNLVALHLESVRGNLNSIDERKVPQLNSLTLHWFETPPDEILLESLVKKL